MSSIKIGEIIESEINEIIEKGVKKKFLLFGEEQICLLRRFQNYTYEIENFQIRNDDIIVASFPKSGTTWTQEIVWLIKNRVDLKGAEVNLQQRFPMLDAATLLNHTAYKYPHHQNSIQYIKENKGQRFIKTHFPISLLPKDIKNGRKTPKIIYVIRNPKDVFISYYHHGLLIHDWKITLPDFAKIFLSDRVLYGPYWKHVLGFHNLRHQDNVLIIKYEDMKTDLKSVIHKITKFLDEEPLSPEELEILLKRVDFNFMKYNKSVNRDELIDKSKPSGSFMRSGIIGSHKQEMSFEMIKQFDEWIEKNISHTDFDKTYSLQA